MSIDSMRVGGGRCPPLLVGGLFIACVMMVCNWWTLSSTNLELLRQIDELNEQIKISVEERDQCVTLRGIFENQVKNCLLDARTAHVKLFQVDETVSSCTKELKYYKEIDIAKTGTIEALKIDKKLISVQLESKQEANKMLEEELNKTKDELEKVKISVNESLQKQIPPLPIVHLREKLQLNNKTALNTVSNAQVNAPPNAVNVEPQGGQNLPEKDNSNIRDDNAAEVNDGINAIESDLNFNLMSDVKLHEAKK